jgi:decaprenylphospho-beta-D-erythro-pentofuranosid-2-ulose 2-reductase
MNLEGKRVLVLGATSAIAQEFARRAAERHCKLVLVARNQQRLDAVAADLLARGAAGAASVLCDLSIPEKHTSVLDQAWDYFGGIDLAFIAYGIYAERDEAEQSATLLALLQTDFVSAAHLSVAIAQRFLESNAGHLAVITSVAGDRGRKRNYVYGSAKGGLSILLQGLDHKLANTGVRISDIRLGMADTPMTAQMPKSALKASPARAVAAMLRGIEREHSVIYAPGFWKWIMLGVRLIPRPMMNRMDL